MGASRSVLEDTRDGENQRDQVLGEHLYMMMMPTHTHPGEFTVEGTPAASRRTLFRPATGVEMDLLRLDSWQFANRSKRFRTFSVPTTLSEFVGTS